MEGFNLSVKSLMCCSNLTAKFLHLHGFEIVLNFSIRFLIFFQNFIFNYLTTMQIQFYFKTNKLYYIFQT